MQFEVDIITSLQKVASPALTVFFQIISLLGSYLGFIILLLAFFMLNKKFSYVFGICFLSGVGLNYLLKTIIARPRPYVSHPEIQNLTDTLGNSMPSSHALCVVVLSVFLCYYVFKSTKSPLWRTITVSASVVMIALTWTSRLYLGMHYLTDILVGAIIGVVISALGIIYLEIKEKKRKQNDLLISQ